MNQIKILWADDEIDLLRPQILFLENKGYFVKCVTNGHDALDCLEEQDYDVVLLDESMPGISGIETLEQIKAKSSNLPVVLITKNQAEDLMDQAIGSKINDFLLKPVHPNQVLLSIKKITENKRLIKEKVSSDYQQDFQNIFSEISAARDYRDWVAIYRKIISWELKLEDSKSEEMSDILQMQKSEANKEFSKYVDRNYKHLLHSEDSPDFSHEIMRKQVFSLVQSDRPTIFLLLDNLRYDQWKIIEPVIAELFSIESEEYFFSILPSCTQYSRNAIFSGMMPLEIAIHHRQWWLYDFEEGGKNQFEKQLLESQLKRLIRRPIKMSYHKITNTTAAKNLSDNILNQLHNDLTCIVYNFIDMLSHARTEMEVLKELAGDEKAYRSLTKSWFEHSPLLVALKKLAKKDIDIVLTTDHGTIRVNTPSKVIGEKKTTSNLRYKEGRNLKYQSKDVLTAAHPSEIGLPSPNISSTYIFAKTDKFFLYPNNYNKFNNYFKDTFQHGGISLEEMICPLIKLKSKG